MTPLDFFKKTSARFPVVFETTKTGVLSRTWTFSHTNWVGFFFCLKLKRPRAWVLPQHKTEKLNLMKCKVSPRFPEMHIYPADRVESHPGWTAAAEAPGRPEWIHRVSSRRGIFFNSQRTKEPQWNFPLSSFLSSGASHEHRESIQPRRTAPTRDHYTPICVG